MKRNGVWPLLLAAFLLIIAGCGGEPAKEDAAQNNEETQAPESPAVAGPEPVTLAYYNLSGIGEENQYDAFLNHILRAMPHVTIQYTHANQNLNDVIAAGGKPDFILHNPTWIQRLLDLDLLEDAMPLVRSNNLNLSLFNDGIIDSVRSFFPDGELKSIPLSVDPHALYYNIDLFDEFGVPYPRDGMTWDEAFELARLMTRTIDGVIYRGLDFAHNHYIDYNILSLPLVDPVTERAVVNTDDWSRYLNHFVRFFRIPGNEPYPGMPGLNDEFIKEKTLAMRVGTNILWNILATHRDGSAVNWDLVTMPSYPERPNTNISYTGNLMSVAKTSQHKDTAFQAIQVLLTEEVQRAWASGSLTSGLRFSVLKNPSIAESIGSADPYFQGKNVSASVRYATAAGPVGTPYNDAAKTIMKSKFNEVRAGTTDINTALREAEEAINLQIAEMKRQ